MSVISNLLKEDKEFVWDGKCQEAFDVLKMIMHKDTLLTFPDPNREFVIVMDSSLYGLGACLLQKDSETGKYVIIAFYSKTLNQAETLYSTSERELLAIINSLIFFEKFRGNSRFIVHTDHAPLLSVMSTRPLTRIIERLRLRLVGCNHIDR